MKPPALATLEPELKGPLAAIPAERVHAVLRSMSDPDWDQLRTLLHESLNQANKDTDIAMLERLFRKGEAIGAVAGGTVLQMVQAIADRPALLEALRKASEHARERVRFILREMSDADWAAFKAALTNALDQPTKTDDLGVLELVCRIGESVSNIEVAAQALAEKRSGLKLIDPEVVRKNALLRASVPGAAHVDPEAAWQAARKALDAAEQTARRAENTLACRYVQPTAPYRHARHAVFKLIDAILQRPALMAELAAIERRLAAVPPVSREQMRWALHRMPLSDRLKLIKLLPLNTILMFQPEGASPTLVSLMARAARDRLLAYDLFIRGRSDEDLITAFGLSANAVKNTVGVILQTLVDKPLARQPVHDFLAQVAAIPPIGPEEIRRRLKQLNPAQRAMLLHGIPQCAWKARNVAQLHKHLFLDYLSGEWVLGALVAYYNLEKTKRLTGTFKLEGTLTVRGAQSAIVGVLRKLADETTLCQQLRQWTARDPVAESAPTPAAESTEPSADAVLPPPPAAERGVYAASL